MDCAGLAPGFIGLLQMNVRIPDNAPAGEQAFDVSVGGVAAASAWRSPPRRRRPPRRELPAAQFYPLTPVDAGAQIQGGTIVRIGMPRRALASFGWPVDPDDSGGAIEAEVVLDGDTGMARAIRFVGSRQ